MHCVDVVVVSRATTPRQLPFEFILGQALNDEPCPICKVYGHNVFGITALLNESLPLAGDDAI